MTVSWSLSPGEFTGNDTTTFKLHHDIRRTITSIKYLKHVQWRIVARQEANEKLFEIA
jgi:hypothetical protein